jgi:hypothetical protein
MPSESGGIEYWCVSWSTMPVGPTDRQTQRQICWRHLQWPQTRAVFLHPFFRDHTGGPRGTLGIHLQVPSAQLLPQIVFVQEATLLEEGPLDPAHKVLDRALLLRALRPAQLDPQTQVERYAGEGGIPLRHLAVPKAACCQGRPSRAPRRSAFGSLPG